MATHYPRRTANENNQGLHYSDFPPVAVIDTHVEQSLARRDPHEIAEMGRESAKLG
ncbi:MAG: hypothetical protein ACE5LB_13850 [Acidiferrobacterales bacterium]